jgi:UDP-N-acetylglucosamine pyrophosphorylase
MNNNKSVKKLNNKKSEWDRMHEKCKAYFQPVGELENSLLDMITRESMRCRSLSRLTDAAEQNLEHSVVVLRKVQSYRLDSSDAKVPEMSIQ